jgi:ribosome-associated toxin RatA of RatAB toxin-antitoxin module
MSEFAADNEAPVYSREEIVVAASAETVWRLISEIEEWPRWNPEVRAARLKESNGHTKVVLEESWDGVLARLSSQALAEDARQGGS